MIIGEYEEALNIIELIKTFAKLNLISCCEIYYGFYTYCYNKKPVPPNISRQIDVPLQPFAKFTDDHDTPKWAKEAIAVVAEQGIVNGRSHNRFAPNETPTRVEAVTVLLRFLALQIGE